MVAVDREGAISSLPASWTGEWVRGAGRSYCTCCMEPRREAKESLEPKRATLGGRSDESGRGWAGGASRDGLMLGAGELCVCGCD